VTSVKCHRTICLLFNFPCSLAVSATTRLVIIYSHKYKHSTGVLIVFFFVVSGYLLFKDFCETMAEEPVPQLRFYEEVSIK